MRVMLFTSEQCSFYSRYLDCIDSDKWIHKVKSPLEISPDDKERLIEDDEMFFMVYGYHMIQDYEKLK